jgi:hypothetical protein
LKRLLGHEVDAATPRDNDLDILDASTWGPVLAVGALFDQLGLWTILDAKLANLCLGWPDRLRDVSPYFLGHPDRIGPKSVVTM